MWYRFIARLRDKRSTPGLQRLLPFTDTTRMLKVHQPPELVECSTGGALRELVGTSEGCYARSRATRRRRHHRPLSPRPLREQAAPRKGATQAAVVSGK